MSRSATQLKEQPCRCFRGPNFVSNRAILQCCSLRLSEVSEEGENSTGRASPDVDLAEFLLNQECGISDLRASCGILSGTSTFFKSPNLGAGVGTGLEKELRGKMTPLHFVEA